MYNCPQGLIGIQKISKKESSKKQMSLKISSFMKLTSLCFRIDEFLDFWQSGLNASIMQAARHNLFYKAALRLSQKDPVQSVGELWVMVSFGIPSRQV
jgi:hypothetical protein